MYVAQLAPYIAFKFVSKTIFPSVNSSKTNDYSSTVSKPAVTKGIQIDTNSLIALQQFLLSFCFVFFFVCS